MSKQPIQPVYLSLADLLHKRLFNIPAYQRAYSWTDRERKDLFEDITNVSKANADTSHFMSTIVCLEKGTVTLDTDPYTNLDIVDGQQRLTTLIILLKAITLAIDPKDEKQQRLFQELSNLLVKDGGQPLLLQTNPDKRFYFANYMRKGNAPQPTVATTLADKELLSAIQDCKKFVEDWRRKATLTDLAALIKNRLSFILYQVPNENLVYTVFEVLNSRGMEVAWLDRLKSTLMGLAFSLKNANPIQLIKELHTIWSDIYETLGLRQGLNSEALRFAATLYASDMRSKLLGEKDAVNLLRSAAEKKGAAEIREIADHLREITIACDAVMSNPRQNAVTRISQARLLAVAIRLRKFKKDDQEKLLDLWERVSFRIYGLYDKDARTGVGEYCRLSWEIFRSGLSSDEIMDRIRRIGEIYPIEEAVAKLDGANWYPDWTDELRYFFYCYEEHLLGKSRKKINPNPRWTHNWNDIWAENASQSIEHIEPQSKGSEDMHGLGNLMLLPPNINAGLKAKKPEKKKDHYQKTGFLHVDEVVELLNEDPGWSKRTRKKREEVLLNWAKSRWADG